MLGVRGVVRGVLDVLVSLLVARMVVDRILGRLVDLVDCRSSVLGDSPSVMTTRYSNHASLGKTLRDGVCFLPDPNHSVLDLCALRNQFWAPGTLRELLLAIPLQVYM